jgi:hypothetical protein
VKSAEEVMEILAAYDLTGSLRDAAELAGCSHHTVGRYVAAREEGRLPEEAPARRAGVIDPFLATLEDLLAAAGSRSFRPGPAGTGAGCTAVTVQGGLPCSLRNSVCCRTRFRRDPDPAGTSLRTAGRGGDHVAGPPDRQSVRPDRRTDATPMTTEVSGDE